MTTIDLKSYARTLLSEVTPAQMEFVTKYLDPNYQSWLNSMQKELTAATDEVARALSRVSTVVGQLELTCRTSEDADKIREFRGRASRIMSELGQWAYFTASIVKMLQTAAKDLGALATDANDYVRTLLNRDDRDLGREAAVARHRFEAIAELREHLTQFGLKETEATETLRKSVPDTDFLPQAVRGFDAEFSLFASRINAVSPSDETLNSKRARGLLGKLREEMKAARTRWEKALEEEMASPLLVDVVGDLKAEEQIRADLRRTEERLVILDRWETAGREAIRGELRDIEEAMRALLNVSPRARDHDRQRDALIERAKLLPARALKVQEAEAELFAQEQQRLLQRLIGLEQEFAGLRKTIPKAQRGPMTQTGSDARLAVTGLNGSNYDSLSAAVALVDLFARQVVLGRSIERINGTITDHLSEIGRLTKAGAEGPMATALSELALQVKAFEGDWMTRSPDAALQEATDLLRQARALTETAETLRKHREEVAGRIRLAEAELKTFERAFAELIKGSPAEGRTYRGEYQAELNRFRFWNATKTDPGFYTTLLAAVDTLTDTLKARIADMTRLSQMSPQEVKEAAEKVQRDYERVVATETDPGKLTTALATRDKELAALTLRQDLIAESNRAVERDEKLARDGETFLREARALETSIGEEQKTAAETDPLRTQSEEIARLFKRLNLTADLVRQKPPAANGTTALAELEQARRQIALIRKRGASVDKTKLIAIVDVWDKAVESFATATEKLTEEVRGWAGQNGIGGDPAAQLDQALVPVIGGMRAHKFGLPATTLGGTTATPEERRAAREEALAEVRRLRKLVLDDPVVWKCVMNPFKVGGLATPVQFALEEIEMNVLRGV